MGRTPAEEVESTEIDGTEIEIGDVLWLPVSRKKAYTHLEVIGIDVGDEKRVYLQQGGHRYTLSTGDAIGIAILTGDEIETTEILDVQIPESLQRREEEDDIPEYDDLSLDIDDAEEREDNVERQKMKDTTQLSEGDELDVTLRKSNGEIEKGSLTVTDVESTRVAHVTNDNDLKLTLNWHGQSLGSDDRICSVMRIDEELAEITAISIADEEVED